MINNLSFFLSGIEHGEVDDVYPDGWTITTSVANLSSISRQFLFFQVLSEMVMVSSEERGTGGTTC